MIFLCFILFFDILFLVVAMILRKAVSKPPFSPFCDLSKADLVVKERYSPLADQKPMVMLTTGFPNITNSEFKNQFGIVDTTKLCGTGRDGGGTNNVLKTKKMGN